jgi:CBS domain-containing protein
MKVHHVMTANPFTCRLDTPLDEASRMMNEGHSGTLVVVNRRHHPAGILTDRDLAMAVGKTPRPPSEILVQEAMTSPVHTCTADDNLSTALERMASAEVRRLPVLDASGALTGIVSMDDVVVWGLHDGGVTRKELLRALRAVCGPQERLLRRDDLDESPEVTTELD